jgi:hypothetical protein
VLRIFGLVLGILIGAVVLLTSFAFGPTAYKRLTDGRFVSYIVESQAGGWVDITRFFGERPIVDRVIGRLRGSYFECEPADEGTLYRCRRTDSGFFERGYTVLVYVVAGRVTRVEGRTGVTGL